MAGNWPESRRAYDQELVEHLPWEESVATRPSKGLKLEESSPERLLYISYRIVSHPD